MTRLTKIQFLKPIPDLGIAAGDKFDVNFDISIFTMPTPKEVKDLANVMLGLELGLPPEFRFADDDFEVLNMQEVIEKLGYCPDGCFCPDIPDHLPDSISADYGRPEPLNTSQRQQILRANGMH